MKNKALVVGIVLLFTGASVVSGVQLNSSPEPLSRGWLYVGGSGPGNYSRIQDAIDNASAGDTVFVFDDSSPYYETVLINTSLLLQGEDRETTIINASLGDYPDSNFTIGVSINVDNVTVHGFTIQGCNLSGISIAASACTITANILSDNYYGIGMGSANDTQMNGSNTIINNLFLRNDVGIYVSGGQDNFITGNVFVQNMIGVIVVLSANTNLSHNIIAEGDRGVTIMGSYNTVVYRNNISSNENVGVTTWLTSTDRILQNNFIGNTQNAESAQNILLRYLVFKKELNLPLHRNIWSRNYWDDWDGTGPYVIYTKTVFIRHFSFDWHPAQEPYEVPRIAI